MTKFSGNHALEDQQLNSCNFAGHIKINDCRIKNLKGAGNCEVANSETGDTKISGRLILAKTIVHGEIHVTGHLNAEKAGLQDKMKI